MERLGLCQLTGRVAAGHGMMRGRGLWRAGEGRWGNHCHQMTGHDRMDYHDSERIETH